MYAYALLQMSVSFLDLFPLSPNHLYVTVADHSDLDISVQGAIKGITRVVVVEIAEHALSGQGRPVW